VTTEPCSLCGGAHPDGECLGISRSFDSFAMAAAGGGPLAAQALPVGARVGEYQVTGLLGQGGMGVVYSGVHPLLGRRVAIKVLNRQVAHAEAAARFLQEARAASRLRHQNIVDVFAFGQMPDGHYYQVMEYLEGESLRAILDRDGPLTLVQARAVIVGVLGGLAAAHRAGIVHRDIKPDNIFLCVPIGRLAASDVKILDFGLAKNDSGAHASVKTRTGITMGTPAYMSPEQCRALPDIDARADLYAAGIVLFEMLVGHAPFQSQSAFDLMTMQISVPAPRISHATGRVEPLEGVILQAMEKRPAARFDAADEMLAAIDRALPIGVMADYATGSERRPPRRVPDLANHATLVAPSDRAGDVAGMVAAAVSTKPAASSRWWSRASVGVGLGLAGVAAVVASWAGHADRSFASPPVVDPSPIAAPAPPAAVPPAAPAGAPAALGLEVARPSAARPPVQPAVLRQAAGARGGRSHKPAPHSRSHRKKGAGESDLDSPLNPYAR
jgi:eukaryotic-like serine/threonine-protein kinase